MVIYETVIINNQQFEHVYSDADRQVCRDGQAWDEVFNPLGTGRVYSEGELIPETEATAEEIAGILLGGADD